MSTAKVSRLPELLGEGVVDQGTFEFPPPFQSLRLTEIPFPVIDYTKSNPTSIIPPGSVDFVLDTTGQAMQFLSLMVPRTSLVISISTQPSGLQLQQADFMDRPDRPRLSWWARGFLDTTDAVRKLRAWRWSVEYSYLFLAASGEDLETIRDYVESAKLVPVVGTRTRLKDMAGVRQACLLVYEGKGGIGKAVISIA